MNLIMFSSKKKKVIKINYVINIVRKTRYEQTKSSAKYKERMEEILSHLVSFCRAMQKRKFPWSQRKNQTLVFDDGREYKT